MLDMDAIGVAERGGGGGGASAAAASAGADPPLRSAILRLLVASTLFSSFNSVC